MAQIFTRSIRVGKCLSVRSNNLSNKGRSLSNKSDNDVLKHSRPFDAIPRVPAVPLLGSSWAYFPYIGRYNVEKMHKADVHKHMTYGKMVREKFGTLEIVNCYSPEAMYTMMKDTDEYPSRGTLSTLKTYRQMRPFIYSTDGLLTTEGKEWKRRRDGVHTYTLNPEYQDAYLDPMNDIATDFVKLIRNSRDNKQEIENAVAYLNKWSLEAVSVVAFNRRLGCLEPKLEETSINMHLLKAIEIQLECMNKMEVTAGNIPFWKYLPTPTWKKFVKASDAFTAITFNYLHDASLYALAGSIIRRRVIFTNEGLTLFEHLTRTENGGMGAAMAVMTDFMMAGIHTTASTAGFLLYELARNPEKQEAAVKELNTLLPAKEDELTYRQYRQLKYLKNCLKESMRLHPVVRGNVRIFKKDVEICGFRIPAGTPVICVLQVVYRDSTYFKKPNQFYPERWEEEEYPFFQPFGYGARNCIGNSQAELNILTMATEVLRNFRLEYHYEDIDMTTKLINTPDRPIRLRFLER